MSSKDAASRVSLSNGSNPTATLSKVGRATRRRALRWGRGASVSINAEERAAKKAGFSWRFQLFLALVSSVAAAGAAFTLRGWIAQLGSWGYLGAFVINGFSSATIFFPAPGAAVVMVMAQDYNPFLLGVVAGIGGALGSTTSYIVGRLGARAIQHGRLYRLAFWSMQRFGGFILFIFTLIPFLPMDAAGLLAGATRYSVLRFYVYVGIASVIKTVVLLYVAAASMEWMWQWIADRGWNADAFSWLWGP